MSSANSVESLGTLQWDMIELAGNLRQERLFVNSEQQNLQALNEKVLYVSSDLAQQAWVTAQQRVNLNRLIVARPECTPALCCQRANTLEHSHFVDAYKHLRYQTCLSYGEFLAALRKSPKLLAGCLVEGDRLVPDFMESIVQSLCSGIYGSCLLPEDKILILRLLRELMLLQIIPSENPRRLLRHATCAFSKLYAVFHESLFSAKFFLTAALHSPIIQLLMEDEMFLDIDPDKAPIRFPPAERVKKFGKEGTPEYIGKLQRYRVWTVNSLYRITQRFVVSIRESMHCFPSSVYWLVRQMAGLLNKTGRISAKEVHAICTDLVFTYFICPAIVNPEPYGITDAPISYVARFNLMQIGQILQTLSLTKYQAVDSKVTDLYKRFDRDCVSSIIDGMLEGAMELDDEPPSIENGKLQGLSRSAALFTENELNGLVLFLRTISNGDDEDDKDNDTSEDIRKQLNEMLSQLPAGPVSSGKNGTSSYTDSGSKRGGLLGRKGRGGRGTGLGQNSIAEGGDEPNGPTTPEDEQTPTADRSPQDVLVIPFGPMMGESVGLLSEQKVLCMELQNDIRNDGCNVGVVTLNITDDAGRGVADQAGERIETQEKRTRFSLSHDEVLFEGSIGNTSDNLEAVSEAASNHSVASSLELETEDQNDNLSDMVSANVSGRGTPNISGRDTPSSQITEDDGRINEDDGRATGESRQHNLPPATIPTKQSRSEIDDKFCKFEIKKLIEGDETVSMVSDTWSTDVLASDSEIVEQQEQQQQQQQQQLQQIQQRPILPTEPNPILDISETASEAWSMDVLASDSERLTEVDTDDTASVARSDDTAKSEIIEVEREADTNDECQVNASGGGAGVVAGSDSGMFLTSGVPEDSRPTSVSSLTLLPTGNSQSISAASRGTSKYVDKNANSIAGVDYEKCQSEERLVNLIDKLHIDKKRGSVEGQNSFDGCNIGIAAAVGPALLLANHISPPHLGAAKTLASTTTTTVTTPTSASSTTAESNEKLTNGDIKSDLDCDVIVRLSTASLTSSSSSSGSDTRAKSVGIHMPGGTSATSDCVNGIDVTDSNEQSKHHQQRISATTSNHHTSTGTIPKSISFDMTAERGDKESLDDDQKNKRGFFGKLKMSLRNRRGKSIRGADELRCYERDGNGNGNESGGGRGDGSNGGTEGRHRLRRITSEDLPSSCSNVNDSTDDILAKYRRKPSAASDTASVESNQSRTKEVEDERLFIDPNNVELSFAFADAKRKLRMVLSTADVQHTPSNVGSERNGWSQRENELVAFLQLQLAEAINLQDRALIAHLHETLRCVQLFNDDGCRKLFRSLREDYQKRSPYIAYLVRCRQGLLSTLAHLERLCVRVKCDRDAVNSHLVSVCVRVFLEKRESLLLRFCDEFRKLTLADEKQDLVDSFLSKLHGEMDNDPIWQAASECQLDLARTVVERTVMARVYHNALYPNGDGDIYRDQLLHDHIKKLSRVITPNHKDLRIPKIYHYECPWPWAQAELAVISAYKTPKDKLQCVFRCSTTIMNLLSMASERGIPAADDLIPVLVYVIIKTNPPSLLSTVQYVDSFYGNRLEGEEQYWWTQFCSAIEFIKTMD